MTKEKEFVPIKITAEEQGEFRDIQISEAALDGTAKAITAALAAIAEALMRRRKEAWDGLRKTYDLPKEIDYKLNIATGEITKAP